MIFDWVLLIFWNYHSLFPFKNKGLTSIFFLSILLLNKIYESTSATTPKYKIKELQKGEQQSKLSKLKENLNLRKPNLSEDSFHNYNN